MYKYVLIKIKFADFFSNNYSLQLNIDNLLKDRKKCVDIFETAIFKNSYFLQDTLCRYIDLEEKLKAFNKPK